jgi:hypothetical protein
VTKKPPSEWTNKQIEADPSGYRQAQQREHETRFAEAERKRQADALRSFTDEFVRGDQGAARAEWEKLRNERAAKSAAAADEQARAYMSAATRRVI